MSSDIEGSTRLLQQLGPAYSEVLLAHRALLRGAFEAHRGEEQSTEGDAFFVTFPTASDAVGAALAAQRSLATQTWPAGADVRVRMGAHVGEIQTVAGTIMGMAVHETARIGAAAHGGQVLASARAVELAGSLSDGAAWIDLGGHLLKDIGSPVQLFQLTHPELAADFEPIRSQGASRNNLPAQASAFIGREREVAEVAELLVGSRLVTVTGAGGAGKSRIALRVASEQGTSFDDGVWFVELASVSEETAVEQEIADALGLSGDASADLGAAIGQRQVLLLVDNCEHLIGATAVVLDELLRRCPNLSALATSREPLGVQGEVIWRLPSLEEADAVELFCTRARAVNSRFALTELNRGVVSEVCRRLDAIPLALELAAARLGSLSVEQLAARLDQRFRLLAGGGRGTMARQRTLQATVDWSYDLLEPTAQVVLGRLGAFVGGFTLEAAEAVGATAEVDVLDVLDVVDQLVTKSLVVAEEQSGAVRYRLLETIRHYALDRLLQAGEMRAARDAHLAWVSKLAADAEPALWFGGDDTDWFALLDAEAANLRAGLSWAVEVDEVSVATSILFSTSMWLIARSRLVEGLEVCARLREAGGTEEDRSILAWIEFFFASHGRLHDEVRERVTREMSALPRSSRPWIALPAEGYLAAVSITSEDPTSASRAVDVCQAAVDAARQSHPGVVPMTLQALTWACMEAGELDRARDAASEALALLEAVGMSVWQSRISANRAHVGLRAGDLDAAWHHAERTVEFARRTSDTWVVIAGTQLLAQIAARRGDLRSARDISVSLLGAVGEVEGDEELAYVHREIAWYALLDGDIEVADAHGTRAVDLVTGSATVAASVFSVAGEAARARGDLPRAWALHLRAGRTSGLTGSASAEPEGLASVIEGLAGVRGDLGDPRGAALLLGSAAAHRPAGASRLAAEVELLHGVTEAARSALGDELFRAAAAEGASLGLTAALAVAEAMAPPPAW